ncbi:MAG: hypothetical protein JWM87_698 [Candidatus Eremiobacteraeota bacterium]|nr:hypothetical protein [Candidatus Eremiobacteraeota bacterium]
MTSHNLNPPTPDPSTRDTAAERVLSILRNVDDETLTQVVEYADTDGRVWKNDVDLARSYVEAFAVLLEPALRAALDAQPVNEEADKIAAAIEDRMRKLKPSVFMKDGAANVMLHNFEVMVAFFGRKDEPNRWGDLRAALSSQNPQKGDERG